MPQFNFDKTNDRLDQKKLRLFQNLAEEIEVLHREAGSFNPVRVNHIIVVESHPGWEEYMSSSWHRGGVEKQGRDEKLELCQAGNLFQAGFEPMHEYCIRERFDRKEKTTSWWLKGLLWLLSWIPPRYVWHTWYQSQPLTGWAAIKVNWACMLLDKIHYYHR